jgi:RNA polymerase sigma-70 factor (ECF subfamily)
MAYDPAEKMPSAPAAVLPRVARGDASAIRECIERYGGMVLSMARRLVPADVEDAVQEVFVDVWRSASRFDATLGSEHAFVATIARRRLLDRRRRAAARPVSVVDELPLAVDPGVSPERGAEAAIAARALKELRTEEQKVLMLALYHGLSHEEIAQQTGMPLGTVKSHARRGLLHIRAALLGVKEEEPS